MPKADSKAAEKIAEKKAKIAAKCGKRAAKCAALTLLLAACHVTGCATSDPSSRSTRGEYGDINVCVRVDQCGATSNVVSVSVAFDPPTRATTAKAITHIVLIASSIINPHQSS